VRFLQARTRNARAAPTQRAASAGTAVAPDARYGSYRATAEQALPFSLALLLLRAAHRGSSVRPPFYTRFAAAHTHLLHPAPTHTLPPHHPLPHFPLPPITFACTPWDTGTSTQSTTACRRRSTCCHTPASFRLDLLLPPRARQKRYACRSMDFSFLPREPAALATPTGSHARLPNPHRRLPSHLPSTCAHLGSRAYYCAYHSFTNLSNHLLPHRAPAPPGGHATTGHHAPAPCYRRCLRRGWRGQDGKTGRRHHYVGS